MHCDNLTYLLFILAFTHPTLGVLNNDQKPVLPPSEASKPDSESTTSNVPKIAIVGAGIAGASLAHHLHQLTRLDQPLDITVFESDSQVGGRIRSAYIHNDRYFDVECGAATFTEDDWCLKAAMQEVGLQRARSPRSDHSTGVWDGHDLLIVYDDIDKPLSSDWWHSTKWLWRYGLSFRKIQAMVAQIMKRFPSVVWRPSIKMSHLFEGFSQQEVSQPASSFFEGNDINPKLVQEIIRPESRYRHARDLNQVNLLSSFLALRSAPEIAIRRGNQRLPHRMLKISEAQTRLNTRVSHIMPGEKRRWKVHSQTTKSLITESQQQSSILEDEFDIVLLTVPFAFSGIAIDPLPSAVTLATKVGLYVERHVTLFSTDYPLSPTYFNLTSNTTVPANILTAPRDLRSFPSMSGDSANNTDNDLFSITVVNRVPPPNWGDVYDPTEYVYKIISSQHIPDDQIAHLLGVQLDDNKKLDPLIVTWVHRQIWPHAYAQLNVGEPLLDDLEIAPDLYYTAAVGEIVDTMEMGCRMGRNLAKHLLYSKWRGELFP